MGLSNADLKIVETPEARKNEIRDVAKKVEDELEGKDALVIIAEEAGMKRENVEKEHSGDPKIDALRALVKKRVSEVMFEKDKALPVNEQQEIIDRQIDNYYDFNIQKPEISGHVEAVHGTKPGDELVKWCKEHKTVDYDVHTNEIAQACNNFAFFKKPRLFADVNNLPDKVPASLRSEGAVFTKEYNLNAVKAQRDLTAKILKQENNFTEDGKAKNPYLAVYVHGKVDSRGYDFEIAAKQREGKGPLNPKLAFWLEEKLKAKIKEKGIKNAKGEEATVNVVTYKAAYSGNPSLTRMRYGDGVFDFKGFGENFQALQLECGRHVRDNFSGGIAKMFDEILADFSNEFKTSSNLDKLEEKYGKMFEEKVAKEKSELFAKEGILFKEDFPEDSIALSKSLREELELEDKINFVIVAGVKLKVKKMTKEDLRNGKTMVLNKKFEQKMGDKIEIEAAVEETSGKSEPEAKKPTDNIVDKTSKPGIFRRIWRKIFGRKKSE